MTKTMLLVVGVVFTLGACAPVVRSVPTDATVLNHGAPGTRARPTNTVRMYIGDAPQCVYREVAFIEGDSRQGSVAKTLEKMRAEAARYDADALIVLTHQDAGGGHHSNTQNHNYSGVAVQFSAAPCPERAAGPKRATPPVDIGT